MGLMPTRRGGRVVEGAPLLRAYGSKAHRGFESLPLRQYSAKDWDGTAAGMALLDPCVNIRRPAICGPAAPVAQLDRAPGYEPGGREFESLRARQ